jgi:hypothetical protein
VDTKLLSQIVGEHRSMASLRDADLVGLQRSLLTLLMQVTGEAATRGERGASRRRAHLSVLSPEGRRSSRLAAGSPAPSDIMLSGRPSTADLPVIDLN